MDFSIAAELFRRCLDKLFPFHPTRESNYQRKRLGKTSFEEIIIGQNDLFILLSKMLLFNSESKLEMNQYRSDKMLEKKIIWQEVIVDE